MLKIHRIVAATDCGHAVNPQQIEAQIEGSFAYGLTALLYGEITVKDGRVEQENFDTYQMMRMDEMPAVESIIMPSGGLLGRRRRADDLRRGAGGAQRHLRRDRQAHPLGAADEGGPAQGVRPERRPRGRRPSAKRSIRRAGIATLLLVAATPAAAQAIAPPGAAACSGCHGAGAAGTAVPPLQGLAPDDIVAAMQAFRSGAAAGDCHGPHRQGFHGRGDARHRAWVSRQPRERP